MKIMQVILNYYEENTHRNETKIVRRFRAKAAIGEGRVASFIDQEAAVSRFSSRGPDFIDANRNPTDVLKPDILAPGHQVWAAWSPISALDPILEGELSAEQKLVINMFLHAWCLFIYLFSFGVNAYFLTKSLLESDGLYIPGLNFALLSGTSMATPHVAGIAALIKQYNPSWTPSMITSAIATTATKYDDKNGQLIMAEGFGISSLYPSTPFEFGSGLVSPKRAIDPGLVFSSGNVFYVLIVHYLTFFFNKETYFIITNE